MPRFDCVRDTVIPRTPRVMQLEGMFDIPIAERSQVKWTGELPIESRPWNIGLIVGPSGCGKSTLARELFGKDLIGHFNWPADQSILDGFPAKMGIKDIVGLLSSVGFSAPPSWMRPFGVLSNGEQFRVTIARALAEQPELAVIDEFTSVVDRTVAQIGSSAVAKTVRARNQKFVAVSCHYDIVDWLQPDWIYEPATNSFQWRCLRRRPPIVLEICRARSEAWRIFKSHHYLSSQLSAHAKCFLALVDGRPAAFSSVIHFPHAVSPSWREHRTVCLPDFQGAGIGNAISEFVASLYMATGKPFTSVTSHPSMIRHRSQSSSWVMTRAPSMVPSKHVALESAKKRNNSSFGRLTASFRYIGPPRPIDAQLLDVI